ncbi:MAG: hydroxymethylbilane synthase [Flavobacterium sp.]|nr:hydroxymethylbilane synthase [Flavobacterium sp.]
MNKVIRIGTRDSELALWQAHTVEKKLNDLGYKTEVIPTKSVGDIVLDKPLYEFGITGIFTKTLDAAMISGRIDIAVHSMKDVPTLLPTGIVQAAVLKRESPTDILVHKGQIDFTQPNTIATGSLRRQAQWLHRYPHHEVVDLRGNVNTRLQKLQDNQWNGAVFAAAGLHRINLTPEHFLSLDWMIPAPAQGAMVVAAMQHDDFSREAVGKLNHNESEICTHIERKFLRTLEGGCTAPIGALATIVDNTIRFEGALFSINGKQRVHVERTAELKDYQTLGEMAGNEILTNGGSAIMEKIRADLDK